MEFEERPRDCSPGHAGKEGLHLAMTEASRGFSRGVAFQAPPGSQASSRGEAKDSALLSSPNGYLLEPTEWPKGRQASCGV